MKKITRRGGLAAGAGLLAATLAGCGLSGLTGSMGRPVTGPPVTLTQDIAPSVLVTVAGGTVPGPALSGLVAATARPREDIDILQAGSRPETVVTSSSPAPAKVVVPGKPAAPGGGLTSYQRAGYDKLLQRWHDEIAAGEQAAAARTRNAMSAWSRGLQIAERVSGSGSAGGDPGSLAGECALATSALVGLEEAGNHFGSRRVLLLYAANLGGMPPAGELTGDEVIVVTRFLPSAAAASAAQANLLVAGAAQATVVGSEATAAQLAQLVTVGLSQEVATETLSGPALFANGSAVLLPGAIRVLTRLLRPLRQAGATAVINGYASTPGSVRANYRLSYARAAAVARFLETRGIPASSLVIVGHGASDLTAPGSSGANRRVAVVIEDPSASGSR